MIGKVKETFICERKDLNVLLKKKTNEKIKSFRNIKHDKNCGMYVKD